ncbi:MAG: Glu-tRNA(Gln) amidotransferase subunit GatE [Nanoarchaeota archaeon]|nr:Glu-tRNA(Gln) amidotransferase subunit GatE [Nanoarchaeota archaeon]
MDYKKLNLSVGLEVHYQLDSHKLFCNCPSILSNGEPDIKIKRYLRPVSSELGEKDEVAEFEKAKNKYAIYEAFKESSCLFELDEEPCYEINEEALNVALKVALLLNCKIVDEIQVMRKQVVNYSNTSGFQRSAMAAYGGFIKTKNGKVGIQTVMLEEDAARKISEDSEKVIYRLDRLGTPLIEITTAPDIKTPEQAKEVAEYIGMIVKSTGKNKRGIGSVRQDINISIKNGNRVEVKGFQELKQIPKAVEIEVNRQLKEKTESHVRYINKYLSSKYLRPMPGAARLYVETDVLNINTKDYIKKIKLPKLIVDNVNEVSKKYGISEYLAKEILNKGYEKYFKIRLDNKIIANVLIEVPKDIKKRFNLEIKEENLEKVLDYLSKGLLNKSSVVDALVEMEKNKFDIKKYKKVSVKELEKEIKDIVEKNKGLSVKALMGIVMKKYKSSVSGSEVIKIVKKYL